MNREAQPNRITIKPIRQCLGNILPPTLASRSQFASLHQLQAHLLAFFPRKRPEEKFFHPSLRTWTQKCPQNWIVCRANCYCDLPFLSSSDLPPKLFAEPQNQPLIVRFVDNQECRSLRHDCVEPCAGRFHAVDVGPQHLPLTPCCDLTSTFKEEASFANPPGGVDQEEIPVAC